MATREQVLSELSARIERIQEANLKAYINKPVIEELFNLDSELALDRPGAMETMYTTSAYERSILRRELNNISPGLGDDPQVVEQYALLKVLRARRAMREGTSLSAANAGGVYGF